VKEKCIKVIKGKEGCSLINFSLEEPVFTGHFPKFPVLPGVLLVDLLSRLAIKTLGKTPETTVIKELNKVRFRQQVQPGDTIELETRVFGPNQVRGWGLKGGRIVMEAEFLLQEAGNEKENSPHGNN